MFWYQGMRDHGQGNGNHPVQMTMVQASTRQDAKAMCWRACYGQWMPYQSQASSDNLSDADKVALKNAMVAVGFTVREIDEPQPYTGP
jgi:hypothetical protein